MGPRKIGADRRNRTVTDKHGALAAHLGHTRDDVVGPAIPFHTNSSGQVGLHTAAQARANLCQNTPAVATPLCVGPLGGLPAADIHEKREEQRRTVQERCERVADLVNHTGQPALVWCQLNEEGDLLERMIPDAVQVSGKQSDDAKEERLTAFAQNRARVLITKHKIGAWGLNLQHCNHIVTFPTDSYEQHYQGVRRCWRFGQKRPVRVDIVTTEGGQRTLANLQEKAAAADRMFTNLVNEMNASMHISRSRAFTLATEIPQWLSTTRS